MKKLYSFLLMFVALSLLSAGGARAQLNITNLIVRAVTPPDAQGFGSGVNWQQMSGGTNANLLSDYDGEQMSAAYQVPFNFTFVDQQITTSNTFRVNNYGSVSFSQTWPSTANYDYGSYDWFYLSEYGTVYDYIPYALYENEQDDPYGYSYYANYKLAPFEGFLTYYYNAPGYAVSWNVLGSAPNRELVVQALNVPAYQYGASPNLFGSWQAVVYEAGISHFRFNYGPQTGTWNTTWGYDYEYGGWLVERYSGYTAVKTTGGTYLTIGWNGNGTNPSAQPLVSYMNNYSQSGYYNPAFNGYAAEDNATEPHLPLASMDIRAPFNYDFSLDAITDPLNEENYRKNVAITPTVQFTNQGMQTPTSLEISFTITIKNGPQVYNQTITVPGADLPPGLSFASMIDSDFAQFTPRDTTINGVFYNGYNIYEDTAILFNLQPTADQDPSNNEVTNEFIVPPPNDIKTVSIIAPPTGTGYLDRTAIDLGTPISIRFRNLGLDSQTNVPLTAVVHDPQGNVEFRDTVWIPNWPSGPLGGNSDGTTDMSTTGQGPGKGPYYDTTFYVPDDPSKQWTPIVTGEHLICGIAILGDDNLRGDDTICSPTLVRPVFDAAAVSVVNPPADGQEPENSSWKPAALFQSDGVYDIFDVPVKCVIYSCSNPNVPVFIADSTMPALNIDEGPTRVEWQSDPSVGNYHIDSLKPGCYTIYAIAHYVGDGDPTNDTAVSEFDVIPTLQGNIYVGVGQRFQSIHAAVDSMKYRGLGGPLHLILTDASYTENGSYSIDGVNSASSPHAAIDFRGIPHLSEAYNVTWEPKQGVHPVITFTGSQPACFYWGDLSYGDMTFEGYNPLGVPSPDKLTAEPNKRGMEIVDNETAPGSVFDIEQGPGHITLKDLIIHDNGHFDNDSSSVVRLYNATGYSIYNYPSGVRDTVPIHNVVVNNCELGNAKYGIYDQGLHDMFNVNKSMFIVWRNTSNTFTRNTIGTAADPLSYAGIRFNNEQDLVVSHNEISNINSALASNASSWIDKNTYGILQPDPNKPWIDPGDTINVVEGNDVRCWVDANRIHDVASADGNPYGVAFQQSVTIYSANPNDPNSEQSSLPIQTKNLVTNNMIYDLQSTNGSYPILMNTAGVNYSTDMDSVFNNSISTDNALANITVVHAYHVFLWDNILQNTGAGPYVNYSLMVPHPFQSAISSDYNLFDLHGTNVFDSLTEYDANYGTILQTRYFRTLNDWRSFLGQDIHSLTGNPEFAQGTDSLHMPSALTYIESPASNNGAWLNTSTQLRDFDGDLRLQGNATPDIGADEWDGFQYTNDLAVMAITQPGGFSETSDTSLVTTENPLWVTAQVKNLSSQAVYSRPVTLIVQQAINGGAWNTIFDSASAPLSWDAGQTIAVPFQGPTLNPANVSHSIYRVTVSVPNDQENSNNSQMKTFRVLLKQNAVLVSFNGATAAGINNLDSVEFALARLGVPYDTLDRNAPDGLSDSTDIDYTPWWTLIWVSGDPSVGPSYGSPTGQAGLSFKETQDVERYLNQGRTYAKKNFVVAGQNVAYWNGLEMPNNQPGSVPVTDSEWLHQYMHTQYIANSPVNPGPYNGWIVGQQPAYWKFSDSLNSGSPDVIAPWLNTPSVGPEVNGYAYTYQTHPNTPTDSGAGVSYYNDLINTVFYGFDWADPAQTTPTDLSTGLGGVTTSGTTRTLAAAFAFFTSHGGTILPVQFVNESAEHVGHASALIQWQVAHQKDVARYDIQQQVPESGASTSNKAEWITLGNTVAQNNQAKYAYTENNIDLSRSYTYRIAAIDQNGARVYSNMIELGPDASQMGFTLGQNYPNPTNGLANITFTLPEPSRVTLRVMDVTGKVVNSDVTNVSYGAGQQSVKLDLGQLASGSYVYQLNATGADGQTVTLTKKLTLNK